MNLKSAIETLRTELRKFTSQKQAFADYKLADGTVIRVDGDLVAGTPVYVITEDATLPAPDGEHQVEGVGVVKTEGGKITEVVVAEAPAAEVAAQEVEIEVSPEGEAPEAPAAAGVGLTPEAVQEIVAKHLAAIVEEMKAAMEVEMGKMKEKMASFASQMETMTDIVEKVAELPSEAPKPTASAIVEQRKAATQQNFNALAQAIQNLKKSN
jgi:Asp-tRNA(Asn)/Glu-tRNA(Gln) amidotransferase C subunit